MTMKTKALIAAALLLTAFALGRYTVPTKTVTETHTAQTEIKATEAQTDTNRNRHVETTVTVHESKDGTKETVTHTVQDSQTSQERSTASAQSSQVSTETKTTIEAGGSKLTLSALAGASSHDFTTPVYGAGISKEVLGPISIGAWGLSNGTGGVSLGVSF